MTTMETILGGVIVALISMILGKLWGEAGKVSDSRCKERQDSCVGNVCNTLNTIKSGQEEIKEDMKDIRKQLIEIYGKGLIERRA